LSYLESDSDSHELVVFLPGMGLDASDYSPYLEGGTVHGVALTLLGFDSGGGATDGSAVPLDLHVQLVSAFLGRMREENPGKRQVLVGFSLGADMILRLAEYWRDHKIAVPRLHAVVLFDPNVNHSTMTISRIFAEADPRNQLSVMKSVLQMVSDLHEMRNTCAYISKIATKNFVAICQHARDFVAYWEPSGSYRLIANRLTTLAGLTDNLQVVLSAAYEPHLPGVQAALGQRQPNGTSFELTKLNHFDLIGTDVIDRQLTKVT
jgi:pimeloyl-ACP methyl ester carboxylesterase